VAASEKRRVLTASGGRSRLIGLAGIVALWAAVLARTLADAAPAQRPWYAAGMTVFLLVLLAVVLARPRSGAVLHVAFALQAALVLALLAIAPYRDWLTALFVLQCYQAAVVFTGRACIVWVAVLVALIAASLALQIGVLLGLALALIPMAVGVVIATYVVVNRELEARRAAGERMIGDLRTAQEQLRAYAGQADELAAAEERSRLAHALEASVSETLARLLEASASARRRLAAGDEAEPELETLQALTTEALAQMRHIIDELRPAAPDAPRGDGHPHAEA
jgi:signal transduction histidine kinase